MERAIDSAKSRARGIHLVRNATGVRFRERWFVQRLGLDLRCLLDAYGALATGELVSAAEGCRGKGR